MKSEPAQEELTVWGAGGASRLPSPSPTRGIQQPWLSLSLGLGQDPHPRPEPKVPGQDPHPRPKPKVPGRPPLPPLRAGPARPGRRTAAPRRTPGPRTSSGRRAQQKRLAVADPDPVPVRLHETNQILRLMLQVRRRSLEEVKAQARVLRKANWALAESTRRTEILLVDHVRELLQQQDLFETMIATLESSNQRQLHITKRQLEETEEREKAKMEVLQRQLSRLTARNGKAQEELNVLLAYMDQDFPLKVVQISSLLRQVQQLKDAQQDELEELKLMRRTVLGSMERKAREAKEKILKRLADKKIRPYEEVLAQKTKANKEMVEQISYFQRLVDRLEEEIPRLEAQVKTLQSQTPGLLREIIFPDILLRKPKCLPDTDICLDIPREERLPF
ncbi:uncharacterized protein C20orf96 homolog [Ornithorhynchus anatinus]|uniref:uncharacterized protein C20orf96 homolog n=1 Tax=Ornithorhynchus anatinus TaxID=9258 RepID=UPI0019D4BC84|nr:uncharacterized protein C20orf96 homolog [Ornithorhynchus anatinus]